MDIPSPSLKPGLRTARVPPLTGCLVQPNTVRPERNKGCCTLRPSCGSNDFSSLLNEKLRLSEAKSFTQGHRAPPSMARWMAGVSALPAGSGQTWSLNLLPSTQREGRIRRRTPESFHGLYLPTRKQSVSKSHKCLALPCGPLSLAAWRLLLARRVAVFSETSQDSSI